MFCSLWWRSSSSNSRANSRMCSSICSSFNGGALPIAASSRRRASSTCAARAPSTYGTDSGRKVTTRYKPAGERSALSTQPVQVDKAFGTDMRTTASASAQEPDVTL
eukprot:194960-Chlamydomonas_euryale.AAC.10